MPIPFMDEHWTEVSFWNHCIGKRLLFSFWPRKVIIVIDHYG